MLMKTKIEIPTSIVSYTPSSPCEMCLLNRNCVGSQIRKAFADSSRFRSFRSFSVKSYEHLYFSGDQIEALYIVKSGSFKTYVTNQGGDEQIINFHLAGDILSLDALPTHHFQSSAVALEASSLCVIPSLYFENLVKEFVPDWLIDVLMGQLSQQQRKMSSLGKKNARRRIAAFLCDISDNYQALGYSGREIRLNMSREDIGNYLGLASETISRMLTKMRKEGVVKLNRQNVKIVDYEQLCKLADR